MSITPFNATQHDRLQDVRARARELRDRRARARDFHAQARAAAEAYSGDDLQGSEEFARLSRAVGDIDQIGHAIALVESEERFVLSQMAGLDGASDGLLGRETFLNDPQVLEELNHMAHSQARIGRRDLGLAMSRDELLASYETGSVYNRSTMAAAGDVSVPDPARTRWYGAVPELARPLTLLDLIPTAPMDAGSFDYTPVTGNLDTAAEIAEAVPKPTADVTLGDATAKAQTVAHYHKIPKPQLADVPGLQTVLTNRLVYGVNRRVESQLLSGDGTGVNLLGVLHLSGVGAPASGVGDTVNSDLVLNAKTSVTNSGGVANGIVMNPNDVSKSLKVKASGSGERLDSDGAFGAVPTSMWGLRLVENVACPAGKAIVADWSIAVTLFVREGVHVIVSDADQDDFTRNRLTLLGEGRFAVAWWQPTAVAVVNLSFSA